jgi:hypothetical protein
MMCVRLSLFAIPLPVSFGLFAQVQSSSVGSDIRGQLTQTATVNAIQGSLGLQAFGAGQGRPKIKPNLRQPPQPPFSRSASAIPSIQSFPVSTTNTGVSFLGLTHIGQRLTDSVNQFSVEPSFQSLASGNGYVLEGVNNGIQVYNTAGARLLPAVLTSNWLSGALAAIDRNTFIKGVQPIINVWAERAGLEVH